MKRRTFCTWIGLSWLASISPVTLSATMLQSQYRQERLLQLQGSRLNSIEFYISPFGKDTWSGKLASPNETQTDGPFATLKKARDRIRQLKRQWGGKVEQPIKIILRGGTYFLDKPILFASEDSGTADCPISYQAYDYEKPILSAGIAIKDWRSEKINGVTVWTTTIPEVRSGALFFEQLWVNGQRRFRARYPSQGYLKIKQVPDADQRYWTTGQNNFRFHDRDLETLPENIEGEAVVMNRWVESRLPIDRIDKSSGTISFTKKSLWRLESNDLYYLDHIFQALDTPGEWYLDRQTGKLYYIPMPDEDIRMTEAIAPTQEHILIVEGNPNHHQYVEHLNFRYLTFSHTTWQLPPEIAGFAQCAYGVSAAIDVRGSRACSWEKCTIANIGNYGIELFRGCQNNRIIGCEIFDLGAGGIAVGERETRLAQPSKLQETHSNEIIKNHIYDGGRFFPSAVAIRVAQSYNNTIIHNHIHDLYYIGISVRGIWGYKETLARDNTIEFNYVHHIGKLANGDGPILSDMGAIYTLGVQKGTVIRNNIIHNVSAVRYGGWGIYLDEGSSYIIAEKNIVDRTTHGGFHIHFGKENIIRNNIFTFGRDAQIDRSKAEKHISFTFERNIVYWEKGSLLGGKWKDYNFAFDRNLYWQVDNSDINFDSMPMKEWQEKGMDRNSIIADPMFLNPEEGDFRFPENSPALEIGFLPILNILEAKNSSPSISNAGRGDTSSLRSEDKEIGRHGDRSRGDGNARGA